MALDSIHPENNHTQLSVGGAAFIQKGNKVSTILDSNILPRSLLLWLENNTENSSWFQKNCNMGEYGGEHMGYFYLFLQGQKIPFQDDVKKVDTTLSLIKQLRIGTTGFNIDEIETYYDDIGKKNIIDVGKIFQEIPGDFSNKILFLNIVCGFHDIGEYWAYKDNSMGYYSVDNDELKFQVPKFNSKTQQKAFGLRIRSFL